MAEQDERIELRSTSKIGIHKHGVGLEFRLIASDGRELPCYCEYETLRTILSELTALTDIASEMRDAAPPVPEPDQIPIRTRKLTGMSIGQLGENLLLRIESGRVFHVNFEVTPDQLPELQHVLTLPGRRQSTEPPGRPN